ncbi:MAG: hypothetical protein IKE69_10665 [Thermoguttaceae bacterium]|nr:hypothetical protein [Thermoguttaceae bacterium]
MSHSDKDDFEKDPFGENGFGNDPFSENGKENDSGQSGDEPSFDELFGNFQSSGSESLDSFDFDDAASGDRKDSPKGEDGAGNDFFADLLNDSSDSPKEDTLAGLAGLENLMGGDRNAAEDTASRLDALKPEGDGVSPNLSEDGADFDFDFDTADGGSGAAPESGGGLDLDFSDLSAEGNAPAAGDDTASRLGDLEDLLGGSDAGSTAADADAGLDSDFFKNLQVGDGDSPAAAEGGSDLKPEFPDSADAPESGEGGLDFDFSDLSAEGESSAPDVDAGLDSDFFKNLQAGDGDSPVSAEGGSDLKPEFPDFADAPESGEGGIDFDFSDLSAEGDAPAADAESGLDSDFFKNLQVGDGESPAAAEVGSDLKPEFPDFADAPESGEGGTDFDFSDLSAEGDTPAADADAGLDSDFFKNLQVGDGESPASAEGGSAPRLDDLGDLLDGSEGESSAPDVDAGLDSDFFKNLQVGDGDSPAAADGGVSELKPELPEFADAPESGGAAESAPDADFDFDFAAPESAGAAGEPSASEEFDLDSNVIGGFGDDSLRASEEAPTEEGSKDPFDFPRESDDDFLKDLEGEDVFDVSQDENAGTDAESPASGIDFSDAASEASFAGENEHPLEDALDAPTEKSGTEPSLDDLLGGEIGAPDDTAARLGGLEDMLGPESSDDTAARLGGLEDMLGSESSDDTAARLENLSAESGGEGELDPDFFGGSTEESGAARNDQTDGEFPFDDAEDGIDTKTVPADADGGDDFPAFDDEGTNEFAALNTGDSGEGESTTAALAGFEGLVSSDGPAAGDDTAALLGALTGEGEPAKDESTTAGLAGLENLLGSGDDRDEETAVRLSRLADEQEEDESPDERSLDDILTDGDAASESGAADFPAFDDAGFGDEFGIGAGDDSAPADDLSEFTGEGGGFGDEFGAVPAEDATAEEEEEESAESGKGKKKKKEKGPKKEKSRRRRKQEQLDPVSKLLVIPQVFFIVYMILGNIKGILEWHGKGAEFFTLPFFLLAFNGTGFVLFLLPALLRAFRKRYAEDTKLTEYTLFMFMLAMAVAAMIMACHPLIFDLARNWGGPH